MSWRLTPHSVRVFYLKNTMDGLEMYVHIYMCILFIFILFHWHGPSPTLRVALFVPMCVTQYRIQGNQGKHWLGL